MAKLEFSLFKAEIPRVADHLLPANYAKLARNCNTSKGDLRAFRAPLRVEALSTVNVRSLYRYEENGNYHWVASSNACHYAKSPVSGDQYERVYFTGETEPRFFANDNISATFDASTDFYKLGIPAPTAALTVGAGSGATYAGYVYSFANHYGDEGPPSPVGSIMTYDPGYITLSDIEAAPADRAINRIYVYRTNASAAGTGEFQFVLEATWFSATVAYAVGEYVIYSNALYKCTTIHPAGAWDAGHFTAGENVAAADLLALFPKVGFDPPPSGLKGLIPLAYGGMAGFVGNLLYLSEPYYPHAYPTDYIIPFNGDIVGISAAKNTITVTMKGKPYVVYGTHPSSMTKSEISFDYPGLDIRGITSGLDGVFFVTRQGIIYNGLTGFINRTEAIMTKEDLSEYNPNTLAINVFDNKIFGWDRIEETGFSIDLSGELAQFVPLSVFAHAGHVTDDGQFYIVADDLAAVDENNPPANMPVAVFLWEGDTTNYLLYTWQSREEVLSKDISFSVAKIVLDGAFYQDVIALADVVTDNEALILAGLDGALGLDGPIAGGNALGGDGLAEIGSLSISSDTSFKLYGNETILKSKLISSDIKIFRLPPRKANRIYIEVSGYLPVKKIILATSVDEL